MPPNAQGQYKCGGCLKLRNAQRFSATAIRKYEAAVASANSSSPSFSRKGGRGGQRGGYNYVNSTDNWNNNDKTRNDNKSQPGEQPYIRLPMCSSCNGRTTHEYDCYKCGLTRSADAFSASQRKKGDLKECKDCVQEREDREGNFDDEVREQEIMEELRNGSTTIGYVPSNLSVSGLSLHSHVQQGSNGRSQVQSHGDGHQGHHRPGHPHGGQSSHSGGDHEDESSWALPPVPIPEDPRMLDKNNQIRRGGVNGADVDTRSNTSTRRLSSGSGNTYHSYSKVPAAMSNTAWNEFEQRYAPYREENNLIGMMSGGGSRDIQSGGSNSHSNQGPGSKFVKQGAVKQDPRLKAHVQLERQRRREQEHAEQAAYADSNSDSHGNGDSDSDDPY